MNSKKSGRILFNETIFDIETMQTSHHACQSTFHRTYYIFVIFLCACKHFYSTVSPAECAGDRCGFNGFSSFRRRNSVNLLSNLNSKFSVIFNGSIMQCMRQTFDDCYFIDIFAYKFSIEFNRSAFVSNPISNLLTISFAHAKFYL